MKRGTIGRVQRALASVEARIFLVSLAVHLLFQVPLNAAMPFAYYSELSEGDARAYFPISLHPFPAQPAFSPNKYRRIVLPLLARMFPGERHLAFLIVGVVAASLAAVFFYRIARGSSAHARELTLLFAAVPYLFAGAHLGYTEPLMVAALLAGYDSVNRGRLCLGTACFAFAMLSKEIAVFPVLALFVVSTIGREWRKAAHTVLALALPTVYYLAVGLRWGDVLWLLRGDVERANVGFTPWVIAQLLRAAPREPLPFLLALDQMANIALLAVLILAIWKLAGQRHLFVYLALSCVPLLFLGPAVVYYNWHVGRQALIAPLSLLGLDAVIPRLRPLLWLVLLLMLGMSVYQSLFWAKFFWFHKLW